MPTKPSLTPLGAGQLLLLSALWGGSFLFMRMAATAVGPAWLIVGRVGLAAVFLFIVSLWIRKALQVRTHWRHYLALGFFNSALPFLLFAYAAQTLSASLLSILNATAPIWAALIAALWFKTETPIIKWVGMATGLAGVGVVTGTGSDASLQGNGLAVSASLAATLSYAVATHYTRFAPSVDSFCNAHGSMWAALVVILPLAVLTPYPADAHWVPTGLAVVGLGVLCSGVAYLIYFRLVSQFGGITALSVTFLIPVFGTLWGVVFLGEAVTWATAVGSVLVLLGAAWVTGFTIKGLRGAQP